VLGGWQVSGITQLQSGFPFTVGSGDFSNTGSGNARPDRSCFGNGPKTLAKWFDTSCFNTTDLLASQLAGNFRFGDSGRNVLSGPGFNDFDFAALKRFSLGERFKLEFRAELYNMWNTPNFDYPSVRITSANFGKITNTNGPARQV